MAGVCVWSEEETKVLLDLTHCQSTAATLGEREQRESDTTKHSEHEMQFVSLMVVIYLPRRPILQRGLISAGQAIEIPTFSSRRLKRVLKFCLVVVGLKRTSLRFGLFSQRATSKMSHKRICGSLAPRWCAYSPWRSLLTGEGKVKGEPRSE